MGRRPPTNVWLSFALLIASMAIATWQAIDRFQKVPVRVDDPGAVQNAGVFMGLTLFGVWLLVALPATGTLYGLRFCRAILAICTLLGVLLTLVYHPPGGWDGLTIILTAVQVLAVAALYVGASRPFFARDADR